MVKIAIIADDLTGANDSGVQLVSAGLRTSVIFEAGRSAGSDTDAVVFDTDSRSVPSAEAYRRVRAAAESIARHYAGCEIFKKIDSTLRGNIGAELDAVYEAFRPDFLVVAPAFPRAGRQTVEGIHYLHGHPLHETEVASDPKTPVTESYVPGLIREQTERPIALVALPHLRGDEAAFRNAVDGYRQSGVPYLVFDAEEEADLQLIVRRMRASGYRIVWVGSAGLASFLPLPGVGSRDNRELAPCGRPVLLIVGSVSPRSRKQLGQVLERVLEQPGVTAVPVNAEQIVSSPESAAAELAWAVAAAAEALRSGSSVALYSTGEAEDVEQVKQIAQARGWERSEASDRIATFLGEAARRLCRQQAVGGMVLTGGDTAKQVCSRLGAVAAELIGEVENGIPLGIWACGDVEMPVVTKAGSFGTDEALWNAVLQLRKGRKIG